MRFLFLLFLPLIALITPGCSSTDKPKLYLFTWSDFFDPALIAEFESQYNCRVVTDVYDSNESMYAKLKLASGSYDIICPSHYYVDILGEQKIIQPLDPKRLVHLADLDTHYFTLTDPLYAVPFIVSFSGIAYRKDRVKDVEPSYSVFGREDLRGRMTMLNDSREAIGAALKYLGYSINTTNPEEIQQAGDQLIKWKRNLAKFESDQYKSGLSNGEFLIVQGYSTDIAQVQVENRNVEYIFPKEGSIMSIDCLAIPVRAQNKELAYEFINFMTSSKSAVTNTIYTGSLSPISSAYELLDPDFRNSPLFFPPAEVLEKMERIQDLQGDTNLYYRTWDRVKGG